MILFPTEDTERKNRREHRGNNLPYCINSIANWYNTDSPLVLYNAECKSGGVQKLSGPVFCKQIRRSAEIKQSGFLQTNPEECKN